MGNNKQCPICGELNNDISTKCLLCETDLSGKLILDNKQQYINSTNLKSDDECTSVTKPRIIINTSYRFFLHSFDGTYSYQIIDEYVTIGREQGMSEYLRNKSYVSRLHAAMIINENQLIVKNLSNVNSTYVNNRKMNFEEQIILQDGDEIGFGGFIKNGKRQAEAAYFIVRIEKINNYHDIKETIVLSDNVITLIEARELLVYHYTNKALLKEEARELITILDSYTHFFNVASTVIKKLFPAPQMTHDKFMGELLRSEAAFLSLMCKGADIIAVAIKHTDRRDEILAKIKEDAYSLAEICDDLATVLINKQIDIGNDENTIEEVEALLSDLQMLVESVKNYT